jgi:hypothetical protein
MRMYGIFIIILIVSGSTSPSFAQKQTTGVEISLSLDNPVLRVGSKVTLVTKMTNTLPYPIKVQVGWTSDGPSLESGAAYQVFVMEDDGEKRELRRTGFIGYCGTGAKPMIIELNKSEHELFYREVWLDEWIDGNMYLYFGLDSGFQIEPPCNLEIRAAHEVRESYYFSKMYYDPNPQEIEGSYWVGEIQSNTLNLRVERAVEDQPLSN